MDSLASPDTVSPVAFLPGQDEPGIAPDATRDGPRVAFHAPSGAVFSRARSCRRFSAPRDDIARASCGNGAKSEFRQLTPHTVLITNLGERKAGKRVNLECDLPAKYVERRLGSVRRLKA